MSITDFSGSHDDPFDGDDVDDDGSNSIPPWFSPSAHHPSGPPTPPVSPNSQSSNPLTAAAARGAKAIDISDQLINYNDKFGHAQPILFRDNIINQIISVLISKTKPNALLVGAAGVGKTQIVEDIARRIVAGDVPDNLQDATIYELPISSLVSGASLVGQLEQRIEKILEFATDEDNHAIIFIDEIHQLTNATDPTMAKVSQILKPALARGDLRVIGATTSNEARELDNDPAFKRRFSQLIVSELSPEHTEDIIRHVLPVYRAHYHDRINVPDGVIPAIVTLADEYNRVKNHRPDNAITLLDKALAHSTLIYDSMVAEGANLPGGLNLTITTVETVARQLMTGHSDSHDVDIAELKANLSQIKGQDHVTAKVVEILRGRSLGLFPEKTPASWLFAGASGVGKTRIAEIVAHTMTKTAPIIVNMAEYHDPASINRIIGSPDGYVGSTSHREKPFDSLESNPYQVIILDEFEKAHKDVQNIFLSAFDKGVIDTASGKTIDVSKAIIIATTNAGRDTIGRSKLGFAAHGSHDAANLSPDEIAQQLGAAFPKELVGRFDYVTAFNRIDATIYRQCLIEHYDREYSRISETRPAYAAMLPEELPEDVVDMLVASTYVPDHGIRPARRAVEQWMTATVLEKMV